MKRKVIISMIAVMLLLPFSLKAQSPVDGADFGVVVSKDSSPAFGYAISNTFDVQSVGGPLFQFLRASLLYSERSWGPAPEMYVARVFTGREVHYRAAYIALGAGTWAFLVSDGSDHAQVAFSLSGGLRAGPLDLHIGGEVVSFDGPDLYYLSAGLVIVGL